MRYTPLLTSPSQSRLIDKFIALDMKCYKENFLFVGAFNDVMSSAFREPEKWLDEIVKMHLMGEALHISSNRLKLKP